MAHNAGRDYEPEPGDRLDMYGPDDNREYGDDAPDTPDLGVEENVPPPRWRALGLTLEMDIALREKFSYPVHGIGEAAYNPYDTVLFAVGRVADEAGVEPKIVAQEFLDGAWIEAYNGAWIDTYKGFADDSVEDRLAYKRGIEEWVAYKGNQILDRLEKHKEELRTEQTSPMSEEERVESYYRTGPEQAGGAAPASGGMAFEDVLEHARNRGVILPKSHMEYMRTGLEAGKVTADYLMSRVDKIAEKLDKEGYDWHYNNTSNDPKRAVAIYASDNGVQAYIMERTNKETGEKFYAANRIDSDGNHQSLGTSADIRALQNRVEAYNVKIVINEIQGEKRKQAEPEQKSATIGEKERGQTEMQDRFVNRARDKGLKTLEELGLDKLEKVTVKDEKHTPQSLEDVLEHARDRGVVLPKKHIEFMRTGLEAGKVTADYLVSRVDKIAEKYNETKPEWCTTILPDPNKPVAYYISDTGVHAEVYRRTNKETGEHFFSASRIEGFGVNTKYHNLANASTFGEVKNRVEGYYVAIAIKEVAKENKISKEQKTTVETPAAPMNSGPEI